MSLAFLAFAWLLGVAAAAFTGADPAAALAASGLLCAVSFAARPRPGTLALVAAGAVLVFAAGWRYDATVPVPDAVSRFNDGPAVRLHVVVSDGPDTRASSRLYRLELREALVRGRWHPESGAVLMRAPLSPEFEYGDVLELHGYLETPPQLSDFDYREYLLRRGITSIVSYPEIRLVDKDQGRTVHSTLADVRGGLSDRLSAVLPEPEASLSAGILFGARTAMPSDLKTDMIATGTSHLVAVSGQNVSILAGLVITTLAWVIGRRPAAWVALASVVAYAMLVGLQPSVVRAAIMGGLYVLSIVLGRQSAAALTIILAAAGMTALDPQVVHDVSFQLSFSATIGLVTLSPLLANRGHATAAAWPPAAGLPLTRPAIELVAVTLAAVAFTLPITAVNFHRVSLVTPIANLFAVPAFVTVALTSALGVAVGLLPLVGGSLGTMLAWPAAAYMAAVIRLFASLPFASTAVPSLGVGFAIACYALLAALTWLLARSPAPRVEAPVIRWPRRGSVVLPAAFATVLALSAALVWLVATTPPSGRLTITFLDVGQGDATLIEDPDGHRILVDGGPSAEAIEAALGRNLPFYDRRIDLVVLTHPQSDHMGGLPAVLDDYRAGAVLAAPTSVDTDAYRRWTQAVESNAVGRIEASRGQSIELADGARLTVLDPNPASPANAAGTENDASIVLRISKGGVSLLLAADLDAQGEAALISSGTDLSAEVLKVGHHGSQTSTSPQFLTRVHPAVDVISVGAHNPFGHPAPALLERLRGDVVFRTDLQGDIAVSTDGQRIWIDTERDAPD